MFGRPGTCRKAAATIGKSVVAAGLLVIGLMATSAVAKAEDWLGQTIGGDGGSRFSSRCPAYQLVVGAEFRVGDVVDAIRPLCSDFIPGTKLFNVGVAMVGGKVAMVGGKGGQTQRVTCPSEAPVVIGMSVVAQHWRGLYVDKINLNCGAFARVQPGKGSYRPVLKITSRDEWRGGIGVSAEPKNRRDGESVCPEGFLGAGLHGRYGNYIDAVGIVCTRAPANSDAVCGEYRNSVVQQTRDNVQKRCGFGGPRWMIHGDKHFLWCRYDATPAEIASERSQRDNDLKACQARLDAAATQPRTVPVPKRPIDIYAQPPKVTQKPADSGGLNKPGNGSVYGNPRGSGAMNSRRKCPANMVGTWPACKCPPKLTGPNCNQVVVN